MRRVKKKTKKQGQQNRKIRLSQCMIVKNEEKNIERALSWGKGFVWEQIVVDTGSVDRTVELAKKMGAKVVEFPWIDDFSAAKNYALEQAGGDWIAFLDADEYFSEKEAKKIMPLLQSVHQNQKVDLIRSNIAHLNSDGEIIEISLQDRIFRNDPDLRYQYRIHEELYHRGKNGLGVLNAEKQIMILHTGYNESKEKDLEKSERNIRLLKMELEENPKNINCFTYLGDAYGIRGQLAEALAYHRKAISESVPGKEHEYAFTRSGLELLKIFVSCPEYGTEKEFFEISAKLKGSSNASHPDIDYYEGCWYWNREDLEKAAMCFERALSKLERYKGVNAVLVTTQLEIVNCVIAAAALKQGNLQKAVQFAVTALRINKYCAEALRTLLHAFLKECREGTDVGNYWSFLCKIYRTDNLKDVLFVHKLAGDTGFTLLQERALQAVPLELREQVLQNSQSQQM